MEERNDELKQAGESEWAAEPEQAAEPIQAAEPGQSNEAAQVTEQAAEPIQSADSNQAAEPSQSNEPEQTAGSEWPDESIQATDPEWPDEPEQADDPNQSGNPRRLGARLAHALSAQNLRSLFTGRSFRSGSYTALACVATIVVAIVVVALVEALPASYTQIDISRDQTTSISEDTISYLEGLDEDVTIYLICEQGEEDEYLQMLLGKYEAASEHVSVVQKDPVLHPTFTSQYTSEDLANNSLIICCGDSSKVVAYSSLYSINYSTYSYDFGGESAITSAITSLTSDDLPRVYVTTGHGETSLPSTIESDLETANYDTESLSLLSEGSVPSDADAVVICAPTSDLAETERDALLSYLEDGGHLLLITNYDFSATSMPNLAEVMEAYGMEATEGLVIEGSAAQMVSGYPYYLLPTIESHDVTAEVSGTNSYVLFPMAHGLAETADHTSSLTVEQLLTTSTSAYVKVGIDTAETLSYEEGDVEGQTAVGLAATEELDDDSTARVVWYSTSYFLNSEMDSLVGGNNSQLFVSTLTWLTDAETPGASLASKGFGTSTIMVDAQTAGMLSIVVVAVIPAAVLIAGFVIWRSRRRR